MITIGTGEYAVTYALDEKIITHALGSCVALIMHCYETKCTAMAHIVLPEKTAEHHDIYRDAHFASEFVPIFLEYFLNRPYCDVNNLKIVLVGGAESINTDDVFLIGPKNVNEIERLLKLYNLEFDSSETLGNYIRTVEIDAKSGVVKIKRQVMNI